MKNEVPKKLQFSTSYSFPFSVTALEDNAEEIKMSSNLVKEQRVIFTRNLFDEKNDTLSQILNGKSALFVVSENVSQLYGKKLIRYLDSKKDSFQAQVLSIESGEPNKNLNTLAKICEQAAELAVSRNHPIIAVGGGICTDLCGLAASLFRRGIPHIKIPTTLVGLIDAGIATKNGVNLGKRKNLLGTFSPPVASIIDPIFLETLPMRHITCGISESIKMGLVVDPKIYQLWKDHGVNLSSSRMQNPMEVSEELIRRSIFSMLSELSDNLYEHNTYERAVDFGHTFSQHIEEISEYKIFHGEAVAIDMAISCQISQLMGYLSQEVLDEILTLFHNLKLPIHHSCIQFDKLYDSLINVVAHRAGDLNLVIPNDIGRCTFLKKQSELKKSCLKEALSRLADYKSNVLAQSKCILPMQQEECSVDKVLLV